MKALSCRSTATSMLKKNCLALLVGIALSSSVHAQQASAKTQYAISSGELVQVVNEISRKSGLQIVYDIDVLQGIKAADVKGNLTVQQALDKALKGTNLSWTQVNPTTISIKKKTLAPQRSNQEDTSITPPSASSRSVDSSRDVQELEKMVVVGSRLGTSPVESAMPIRVITHEQIDRSGAGNIAQALSYLSEVSVNSTGDRNIGSNNGLGYGSSNSTTVQMRGLPRGTVLILINGRRAGESASFTDTGQFDLSSIPLSLVDRIEVLPAGASAVYGGDGLAGVVNIVLRQDAEGIELRLRHSSADGYATNQASIMWGKRWSKGGLTAVVHWRDDGDLVSNERSLTADVDYRRFGGKDFRDSSGNPAIIYSYAGCDLTMVSCRVPLANRGNLPGLDSPFAVVPSASDGVNLTPADFLATQGQLSFSTPVRNFRSGEQNSGITVNGDINLTDRIQAFADFTYSKRDMDAEEMPFYISTGKNRFGPYGRIPATHPFNPFGVEVGISYKFEDTGIFKDYAQSYYRGALGLRGSINRFQWEVSAWHARDDSETNGDGFSQDAIRAALTSTDPATTINPFVGIGLPPASTEFLETLRAPFGQKMASRTTGFIGHVRGNILSLPAGNVVALLGAEKIRASFSAISDYFLTPSAGSSSSQALFAEARVPILAPAEGERWERMAATAAVRRESSDRFDSSATTETLGLEYRPFESLLLRATYSTAFRPMLIYRAGQSLNNFQDVVNDPQFGNEEFLVTILGGGGVPEDLRPETSTNRTVGLVYRPTDDWNLSLNYWRIRFKDRITTLDTQSIVDGEAHYPGRIIRDPSTNFIEVVDVRSVNIAMMAASGIDLGMEAYWSTSIGSMQASVNATYTHQYEEQRTPTSPILEYLARHNESGWAPRWKIVPRLGWDSGDLVRTMLTGRFISSYVDSRPLTTGPDAGRYLTLGNFWLVDLNVDLSVGRLFKNNSLLSGTKLSFGATNLFNRLPDFCAGCGWAGYDASQYDIDGRTLYAELRASF